MPYEEEEQELSLLDVFNVLWRRKFMIIFITSIFAVCSLIYALTRPIIYRAQCRILPPSGSSGGVMGFSASVGGLADFVGLSGRATTSQVLIGIMQSNGVIDAIIDRFNIMEEMSTDIRDNVRTAVLGKIEAVEDSRSGIISIGYLDEDPQKAADVANAFVEELQRRIQELSMADAIQKRNFFDNQLKQANQELTEAEDVMINYQRESGIIAFESQAQSVISSISSLRSQIAAKNVQITSMQSYARADNPRLRLAKSELEAMTKELHRLEEEQMRSDTAARNRALSGDIALSGYIPEMGIEYQRYVRQLRFATAKYELMLRQYENAKLSEANDLSTISIVDRATPPYNKYLPRRSRICIIGTGAGGCISVFLAFLFEHLRAVKRARRHAYADDYDDDDE